MGLIYHILLFGKSIFKGKSYNEVLGENRLCSFNLNGSEYECIDQNALDLLKKMLNVNPEERITAEDALNHPYLN